MEKTPLEQIGSIVLPQLINLVAGYILSLQGSKEDASTVLTRVGLPADLNITVEDFQKFIEAQKAKV